MSDSHEVLNFYDKDAVLAASKARVGEISNAQRSGLERCLDLATWLDQRGPTLKLS